MKDKKKLKQEMLKMLKGDMMGMKKDKSSLFEGMMPMKEATKVTVVADSPESAAKGLSKAEQIMKAKAESKKKKCSKCDKSPCGCK